MRTVKLNWLLLAIFLFSNYSIHAQKPIDKSSKDQLLIFEQTDRSAIHNAEKVVLNKFVKSKKRPDLTLKKVTRENNFGISHHRYQSTYQQIPIEFGDYIVHEKNGKIYSVSGEQLDLDGLNTIPSVSAEKCFEEALAHVNAEKYLWETDNPDFMVEGYTKPDGELMILPTLKGITSKDELVYKFSIYAVQPFFAGDFYVSAHTGEIVFENSKTCHASVPASGNAIYDGPVNFTAETYNNEYRLVNPTITTGGLFTLEFNVTTNNTSYYLSNETSPTTVFNDQVAAQAHWAGEKTIEYFQQKHNWNSYDNNGSKIIIATDAQNFIGNTVNTNNAQWIINKAFIGKGDGVTYNSFASTDIIGHEITHGVIQNTANLIYQNESGALNESFADIFGESIEYFATNNYDWLVGEDVRIGNGLALRSFLNPNDYFQPDTYLGQNYYTGTANNGGVHVNSGVQNFWFYLLSTGKTGVNDNLDNYSVDAIGFEKAQAIAFRNLSVYLTPNATFMDARAGAIQAAIDLYGAGSLEEISTTNAWHAVGVGPAYNAPPSNCYTGTGQLILNFDNDPSKIVWALSTTSNSVPIHYKQEGTYTAAQANTTVVETLDLSQAGNYRFNILDLGRNGLCCTAGNGSYQVVINNNVIASGDIFDLSEMHLFCMDFPQGPTFETVRPTIPTNINVSGVTSNNATISYDAATDDTGISRYLIFYNDNYVFSNTTSKYLYLTPNTTYVCEVYASDIYGNYSVKGPNMTFTTPALPDNIPPTVPTNLSVNNITTDGFDLTWDASTDNVGVASYDIFIDNVFHSNTTALTSTITGLSDNTTYTSYVIAKDAANNISPNSNVISATTLTTGPICGNGALTLKIKFDNTPQQVAWQIKDNQQNIVAGNYYSTSNLLPGAQIVENIPALPAGDYALVVFDSGGDGLCCTNGNGFFELNDAQNTILSGDAYEFSSVQTFCVGSTNNDVFDLTPPTASVLTASNPTTNTVDLSWTASTDNDVLLGYVIFINGVYVGDLPAGMTSITVPNLTPNTTYDFMIASRDLTGNFSAKSNIATETTLAGVTAAIIHEGYFETGWDGWIDGGNRANRYSGNKSFEGSYSIRLRDNSGVKSSMTSPTLDLSSADSVNITFQYFTRGFENGEDFFIKFRQGFGFVNVAQFVKGTDFTANGFYEASVTLDANAFTFGIIDQFRIQTDASDGTDKIWVDQVIITSYTTGGNSSARPTAISVGEKNFFKGEAPTTITQNPTSFVNTQQTSKTSKNQISVFPNPVQHTFSIQLQGIDVEGIDRIMIYDNYGRLVLTTNDTQEINTEGLTNGIYHLFIMNKNRKHESIKFIKDDLK